MNESDYADDVIAFWDADLLGTEIPRLVLVDMDEEALRIQSGVYRMQDP